MSKPCRKSEREPVDANTSQQTASEYHAKPNIAAAEANEITAARNEKQEAAKRVLEIVELEAAFSPSTAWAIQRANDLETAAHAVWATIEGLHPQNEIERMICTQMIAMHGLTLDATKRAHKAEMLGHYREYVNTANKASRTFAALTEALNKQRGKTSEQKVTVEHVHVYKGGQAIVGNVRSGGRGQFEGKDTSP